MTKIKTFAGIILTFCLFLLASCGGGGGGGRAANTAVIPATTKVLDSGTTAKIASVSSDQATISFTKSTPQLETVTTGDIIVSGTSATVPEGMLRKVKEIQQNGDGSITVLTGPAALEEAVQNGEFSVSRKLRPGDIVSPGATAKTAAAEVSLGSFDVPINNVVLYDADGNTSTTGDQITANGYVRLDPSIDISGKIKDFKVERFNFTATGVETAQITINAAVPLPEFHKRILVKELDLGTQTIWIGSFPLVISINLSVYVGIDGSVSLGVSAGATQKATFTAGAKYENSAWSPIKEFSTEYGIVQPQLSAAASVKCYAGPELSLKFYGIAGPYANINGYLLLEANPLTTPWWEIWSGIEANAGVKVEIEGANVSWLFKNFNVNMRYDVNLLDYKESKARASTPYVSTPPPIIKYSISGTIHSGSNTGPALSGATVWIASQKVITSSTGAFSITGIPAGTYAFSVSKSGYVPYSNLAYYVGSNQTGRSFYLTPQILTYSISGTIRAVNNTGPALSGATVWIADKKVLTNSTGVFFIADISAGTYTFSVSKAGYDTYVNPAYYVGSNQASRDYYLTIANSSLVCPGNVSSSINGIQFNGPVSYKVGTVAANSLTWGTYYQNINYLPLGSYSGSLRARLWAVPYSFSGGRVNAYVLGTFIPNFTGTGAHSSDQLYVGSSSTPMTTNSITGQTSPPPTGMYCIVATIEEFNTLGGCSEPDGYCYDQWIQFSGAMGFL